MLCVCTKHLEAKNLQKILAINIRVNITLYLLSNISKIKGNVWDKNILRKQYFYMQLCNILFTYASSNKT